MKYRFLHLAVLLVPVLVGAPALAQWPASVVGAWTGVANQTAVTLVASVNVVEIAV